MAMPHKVFKQKCEKELIGLFWEARAKKVDELLSIMSGYKSGPYAQVRSWLCSQRVGAIVNKKILHVEPWEVKKQGDFSFALVGFPSVGKSSLVKALTGAQIQIAEYDFTTIKPFSAVMNFSNAHIQLIDLPGIIQGAFSGKGFGKRVIGNARVADKILLVVDSAKPCQLEKIIQELFLFGINVTKENSCVVFTKSDVASAKTINFPSVSFSAFNESLVGELKEFLFKQTGLIRVYPFNSTTPLILSSESTVEDFCDSIHKEIKLKVKFAFVSGASAKFNNQQVSLNHNLNDLDIVELVLKS